MKIPALPRSLALHALTTLSIGVGCAWPLLLSMDIAASAPLCISCCAGVTLAFLLGDCLPRLRALCYPLLLLAIAAVVLPYRHQAQAISAAMTLFLNGQSVALAAYARPVCALVSLLMGGVAASLARSEQAFFPLALLTIGELLALSFLGADIGASALLPLVLAVLLVSRAPGVSLSGVLPSAAVVLGVLALLLPLSGSVVPELAAVAERTKQTIDDYLFFTAPRTAFSFSSTGWQPLGQERMGGPVSPSDDPVMQVETAGRTLLRATVKNEYTGLAWADTTSGRRYLFVSPRYAALRRDLFDQTRPPRAVRALLPENELITVDMRSDAASTLFLTQRFQSPRGDALVAYYSPSSEVFGTRSLAAGDRYTFSGRRLTAGSDGVREAVLTAYDAQDEAYARVKDIYLQLPNAVDPRVHALAQQLTEAEANDFDRANALCTYLQRAFSYTLAQNEPPVTQDFVSWFLFEEQQGYCTAFASALAVMARAVGLPARYVEGYAAIPDSDGIARVTQQNAHAWTEIYFPGFGWLTFDPTPGQGNAPAQGSGSAPDSPPDDDPDDEPQESAATPSPTPTPAPTPTPSPTPEHNDPAVTPTPPVTPPPTPAPSEPPRDPDSRRTPPLLLPLLIVLLLAALIAARLYLCSPGRAARRYRNPGDSLLIWYRATEEALLCMGIAVQPGEAPASFLLRAQEQIGGKTGLLALGKALCLARYSGRRLKSAQAACGETAYRAVLARLTPRQRLRLYARRLRRGMKLR